MQLGRAFNLNSLVEIYETRNDRLISSFLKLINNSDDSQVSIEELEDFYSMINLNDLLPVMNPEQHNGYYFNYTVKTGIREQFDVLRFSENSVLNIELKSELPKYEYSAIKNQLIRHKFILSILKKDRVICCTYLKSKNELYLLDNNNELQVINYELLFKLVDDDYLKRLEIEDVSLSHLIISPYSQPEEFVRHNYFLTNEQFEVRNEVLKSTQNKFSLIGGPGTGKTLILFDLARKYKEDGKRVIIIFSAMMNDAEIISNTTGLEIISVRDFPYIDFNNYDVVLVDEAQRLWDDRYDLLISLDNSIVIFCVDHQQTLHPEEKRRNIEQKLLDNPNIIVHKLKEKIRTNRSMSSFIQKLLNLKAKKIQPDEFENVQIMYFDNKLSARNYIQYMHENENYTPIELTEYVTKSYGNKKRPRIYPQSETTHSVIGREFDNVLVPLDKFFFYNDSAKLDSNYSRGDHYPYDEDSCVFEALTRVKENLLLVIIENPEIYTVAQEILTWKFDKQN